MVGEEVGEAEASPGQSCYFPGYPGDAQALTTHIGGEVGEASPPHCCHERHPGTLNPGVVVEEAGEADISLGNPATSLGVQEVSQYSQPTWMGRQSIHWVLPCVPVLVLPCVPWRCLGILNLSVVGEAEPPHLAAMGGAQALSIHLHGEAGETASPEDSFENYHSQGRSRNMLNPGVLVPRGGVQVCWKAPLWGDV